MSSKSKIQWTEATWNPILGCSKISAGCVNCYAITPVHRMAGNPNAKIKAANEGLTTPNGGNWTGVVRLVAERIGQPLQWRRPRMIFTNSLSDLFHDSLSNDEIAAIFGVMGLASQHTFQVLTKRSIRMAEWFEWIGGKGDEASAYLKYQALKHLPEASRATQLKMAVIPFAWPLPNAWLGVSVENLDTMGRVKNLRKCPAELRFLSLEPLLGPVPLKHNLADIHWVIVGGESGGGARLCQGDWVRSIIDDCRTEQVPVFVKQLGNLFLCRETRTFGRGCIAFMQDFNYLKDPKGGDMSEWPECYRVREMPEDLP
jgi:protein gp37